MIIRCRCHTFINSILTILQLPSHHSFKTFFCVSFQNLRLSCSSRGNRHLLSDLCGWHVSGDLSAEIEFCMDAYISWAVISCLMSVALSSREQCHPVCDQIWICRNLPMSILFQTYSYGRNSIITYWPYKTWGLVAKSAKQDKSTTDISGIWRYSLI